MDCINIVLIIAVNIFLLHICARTLFSAYVTAHAHMRGRFVLTHMSVE